MQVVLQPGSRVFELYYGVRILCLINYSHVSLLPANSRRSVFRHRRTLGQNRRYALICCSLGVTSRLIIAECSTVEPEYYSGKGMECGNYL